MATPTHAFVFINFKYASSLVSLLIIIISFSLMNCNALDGRKILESHYVTFDVKSFFSTSCKTQIQGGRTSRSSRAASLKVRHRYGPCSEKSPNTNNVPSLEEVLAQDQIRVNSIQNHHAFKKDSVVNDDLGSSKVTIPTRPDNIVGSSNYVVKVGLGTPAKGLTLAFDTGSSLTWTQCKPCSGRCYNQQDSIFDPSASTSYSNASCDSTQCSQLSSSPAYRRDCTQESTCVYFTGYGDGSLTIGYLGNERLTLSANDVFDNFTFGCGELNVGLFEDTDGILGLGPDSFSLVSQTAQKYGKYFTYCLPTQSGSDGHLTFGKDNGAPGNLAFTPLKIVEPFYLVNIIAISVGGTQLAINPSLFQSGGGTVVDSGSVVTHLHPTAYNALKDAFKQHMSQYPLAPAVFSLDTCFDVSNHTTVIIPIVSFIFAGNVKVDLRGLEVLLLRGPSILCLAFVANKADTNVGIFGNVQQQTLEVAYDVAGGRLGFASGGCS